MHLLLFSLLPSLIAAHGYLSSPPPRGIQKVSYAIDDIKSPNHKGLCRGEPEGQITPVTPGGQVTLGLTITAPHTGPCEVSILSYPDLKFEQKIASKYDCAAPGKAVPWTIQLPSGVSGHKVLRWYWEGRHVTPGEPYEQCIDVNFGGSGSSAPAPGNAPVSDDQDEAPSAPAPKYDQPASKPAKKSRKKHGKKKHGKKHGKKPANTYTPPPTPTYTPPASGGGNNDDNTHYDDNDGGSGGGCTHGQYRCHGTGYKVCNWGSWIPMSCGAGTRCTQTGDSIACGW